MCNAEKCRVNIVWCMQALTFVPGNVAGNEEDVVDMFRRWSIAYSKVLMCHLREEKHLEEELKVCLLNTYH